MYKKYLRIIISLILSSILLYFYIFKIINWDLFFENFLIYNFWFLIPTIILILINIYFGALRWQLLLKPFKKIKIKIIFKALMLSYFSNLVIPINIGDLIRAYVIKKEENVKYSTIFGSIVLDRIFATSAILIMGIFLLLILPIPTYLFEISEKVKTSLNLIFFILIGIIFLIYILIKFQKTNFIKKNINKKYLDIFQSFLKSITYKRGFKEISLLIFYSLLIRFMYAITTYVLVLGFNINIAFYLFLFVDILVSIIVSIGQHLLGIVGTYEATLTYVLVFLGLSSEQGLFIALLSDFSYFTPIILLGLYYFIKEDWNFKSILKIKKNKEK